MNRTKHPAQGKPGRPRRTDLDPGLIAALRRRNYSWREIAQEVGAGVGTVRLAYGASLDAQLAQRKKDAIRARGTGPALPKHQPGPSRTSVKTSPRSGAKR